MASKRDLVDAHGYTKRRLVSAFVSGAPAGRDVESVSRVRPVIAGLAASALLLGGTAIAGMLAAPLAPGWEDAHVIIGKQSAARHPLSGSQCHLGAAHAPLDGRIPDRRRRRQPAQ